MFKKFVSTGFEYLIAKLTRANRIVYDESNRKVENSARRIVARAKQLVPVQSGNLRDHIDYVMRKSWAHIGVRSGPPGIGGARPENYWHLVELGTKHSPAHPFFRPAAEGDKGAFVNDMIKVGGILEREV